ncbi:MAG: hypothetical protein E7656_02365 [Ruminococcaceae bacterium]|nr:hypothetical protein [Oscillospiraceae bacterium]
MVERFKKLNEYYAAGFYEEPNASPFVRFSRATRRYLENRPLPEYGGEPLYPCGPFYVGLCVRPDYSYTVAVDWDGLGQQDPIATQVLRQDIDVYKLTVPNEHTVGGNMYTHSFPNFRRIVREGLSSYRQRVEKMKNDNLRQGLLDVLDGIKSFHGRSLDLLKKRAPKSELCKALEKVPFGPAETLYEALVCWNFVYYMDGCDNIGHLDADLFDFYRGEDMTETFRCLFWNIDANNGWSGCLGPEYNPLTLQCLKACKGMRRPSLELRVTPDMPQEIWDAAIDSILAGGGSPSLYNEDGYQKALYDLFPDIPKEDRLRFCGGGCTETMLTGISNVGSLDAGINVALIFERFMREKLPSAESFDGFYKEFIEKCRQEISAVLDKVCECQKSRAQFRPQPMRTLLIDDCIEKEKDYNDGGARYTWSVINLAGLINVLDSLLVIKHLVFDGRKFSGEQVLKHLDEGVNFLNFQEIPRHGTDSDEANTMAQRLTFDVCSLFDGKIPYSGGKFLPASIQFTTYTDAGKCVGGTPDGRAAGDPLCDSIGSIHGNDKSGITALLNSASSLCQQKMPGTPILNVKLSAKQASKTIKALANGYFKNGGMQMQITCVSKEDLIDAVKNPDVHGNLIVRIGGYSEYFNRLTPELQQTVIDRTEYCV